MASGTGIQTASTRAALPATHATGSGNALASQPEKGELLPLEAVLQLPAAPLPFPTGRTTFPDLPLQRVMKSLDRARSAPDGAQQPGALTPQHIRTLQNGLGNRAVQRLLQRLTPPTQATHDPAIIHDAAARGIQTPTSPLPFLDRLQPLFGAHDLSGVQAHLGREATLAAQAMNADAFASEKHVVFGGQPDLWTTAHEAAHVVQQQGGVKLSSGVGAVGDVYEQHADAVADRVVAGQSVEGLLGQFSGGGDAGGASEGSPGNPSTGHAVQRSIQIGAAAAYNALPAFKAAIAASNPAAVNVATKQAIAGNGLDAFLTAALASAYAFTFTDINTLLQWVAARGAQGFAAVTPLTAAQTGQALANSRAFKFANEVPNILNYLQAGAANRVVICPDDAAQVTAYFDGTYAAAAAQIHVTSASKLEVSGAWIVARHATQTIALAGVNAFVPQGRTLIAQDPQERGDMHDVKVALALDNRLRVIFGLNDYRRRAEAEDILGYYGNHAQVRLCLDSAQNIKAQANAQRVRGVSSATETIVRAASNNRANTERTLIQETTGLPSPYPARPAQGQPPGNAGAIWAILDAYDQDLVNRGRFANGTNYILINYRDSGHNVTAPRAPSHPELDTGSHGYADLVAAVTAAGYTPVPMGEPPGHAGLLGATNLIQYWTWPSAAAHAPRQTKRQSEYGLLRRLNERYSVKALSMRSGSTDALVFAGIETISLDLATETFTPQQLAGTRLDPTAGSAASWRRAAKRELIKPGRFHQGFLTAPRADNVVPAANAVWTGAINTNAHLPAPPPPPPPAPGAPPAVVAPAPVLPATANAVQVTALITQYFGLQNAQVAQQNFALDAQSPLINIVASAGRILAAHEAAVRARWTQQFQGFGYAASLQWAQDRANALAVACQPVLNRLAAAQQNPITVAHTAATTLRQRATANMPGPQGAAPAVAPAVAAPVVAAVHARAGGYVNNLGAVAAYVAQLNQTIANRAGTLQAVANAQGFGARFAANLARFEAIKEAAEFIEYAVKQLAARVDLDDGVRRGTIVL